MDCNLYSLPHSFNGKTIECSYWKNLYIDRQQISSGHKNKLVAIICKQIWKKWEVITRKIWFIIYLLINYSSSFIPFQCNFLKCLHTFILNFGNIFWFLVISRRRQVSFLYWKIVEIEINFIWNSSSLVLELNITLQHEMWRIHTSDLKDP